jgi:acyl-CoA thioesterase FadM
MRQAVVRETPGAPDQVCAEGSATVVAIDASHRPIRWPAKDRQVFAALQEKAAAAAAASGSE